MKKSLFVLAAMAVSIALLGTAGSRPAAAEGSFVRVPHGLSCSSSYWWRGVELNGKDMGVM